MTAMEQPCRQPKKQDAAFHYMENTGQAARDHGIVAPESRRMPPGDLQVK